MSNHASYPTNYQMWRAYAVAPVITPISFIAIVSMLGVTLPANAVATGFIACYAVAGLIGMPIAFLLRRMNLLNVWTIHGTAFAWGVLWSLFCTIAVVYVVAAIDASIQSLPITIGWFSLLMIPPVVFAGTVFWLLTRKPDAKVNAVIR